MGIAQFKERLASIDKSKSILKDLVDTETKWRCEYCGNPFFVGQLGPSSLIEAKCARCKEKTIFGVCNS